VLPQTALGARIHALVSRVADRDPEFVWKLAVYTRQELHLRSVSHFLAALAVLHRSSKPATKRYIPLVAPVPSDLCRILAVTQGMADAPRDDKHRASAPHGAGHEAPGTYGGRRLRFFPAALRKATQQLFLQYSTYQLAKHDVGRAAVRRRRKTRVAMQRGVCVPQRPDEVWVPALKQVVRAAHVCRPAGVCMAILGKRYPRSLQEWSDSSLAREGEEVFQVRMCVRM